MNNVSRRKTRRWIWIALTCGGTAFAGQDDLDRATARYYAGYPADAIAMLEPLARAGDVAAQYLLGNMSYALRQANAAGDYDPIAWYRMATERGSAEAAYALGAIYNNRWLESRTEEDARLAEFYYQQAADRGYVKAEAPLLKLATRNSARPKARSLTYTNESFASQQPSLPASSEQATAAAGTSGIAPSGDPLADATRLAETLRQLGVGEDLLGGIANDGKAPDKQALRGLLGGLGADSQLIDNLMKLMDHVQSVTEHSLAPGAN